MNYSNANNRLREEETKVVVNEYDLDSLLSQKKTLEAEIKKVDSLIAECKKLDIKTTTEIMKSNAIINEPIIQNG